MNIESLTHGMFRIRTSVDEFEGLRQGLNEICNALAVEDFEKWIGAERDYVRTLLSMMPKSASGALACGSLKRGFYVEPKNAEQIFIEISEANLHIVRNCLYEVCNRIRLYEFRMRVGIDLETALMMLRIMEGVLGPSMRHKIENKPV